MNFNRIAFATGVAALTLASAAAVHAQTQTFPPDGYTPLLFDPGDTKHIFRLNGVLWSCRGDTFCKPVKIDGVADKDLAEAQIESLGSAGARYYLSYKQANLEKGKDVALSCVEERCSKLDAMTGDISSLGTYHVKQGERVQTRLALLRKLDTRNGRAQLLWCTETDCAELPATRDAELHLAYLGTAKADGRNTAWLRDKSGAVLACAQPEEGVSDQLVCDKSRIVLGDFPAGTPSTAMPAAPPPVTSDAERSALAASIDRAIVAGDFANADRLLADGQRRFAGNAAWGPLQQKLATARANREAQLRQTEARRLIVEARRFAQVGDFVHSEQMLQEADKQAPGFAETAQARAQIAAMRTEHGQRYRERYQYQAAIDQALTAEQFWEAERLLGEYGQRFNQDDEYRSRSTRLNQLRTAGPYQARLNEARAHIAKAKQAMDRKDFIVAERELALADRTAPGHPEIAQARADLSRRRIAEERQQDDLRLLLAAIDMALQRKQFEDADRTIEEGRRRHGSYSGWADLQTRTASARRGDDRQATEIRTRNVRTLELVAAARRSTAQGDLVAADKSLDEAEILSKDMPEVAIARAELERATADRARQDAEIRAIAASFDAAIARKQYADADRLLAEGTKRYPSYAGWADLNRRLAEVRRATPNQTGNAPAPAQPPLPPANRPAANTPPAAPTSLLPLVAAAREAIKRSDFAAAEKAIVDAEKIDAKATAVIEVRAELKAAQEQTPDRQGRQRERPPAPAPAPPARN